MTTSNVVPLRPGIEQAAASGHALDTLGRHLDRSKLADQTRRAYRRQAAAYAAWLAEHAEDYPDAYTDVVGAEGAVTAWRRELVHAKAAPSSVNQAIAAVTLMYELAGLRIKVKRVRVPQAGEPPALTKAEEERITRAAARRNARDHAIIAVLRYTGARVEECARLDLADIVMTARTGDIRLVGKGDQVRTNPLPAPARTALTAWLEVRGRDSGPLWTGQRGPLTVSGITQVVLAVGADAGIEGLRPHRLRHTFATRLRQAGADVAQIRELMGHASLDTTGRYFRAGAAERAAIVAQVFDE